jgi:hypothetical protein
MVATMSSKPMETIRSEASVCRTAPGRAHGNTLRIPAGTVIVVTDVRADDSTDEEHTVTLTADDGSFQRSRSTKNGEASRGGFVDLVFDDVPTRRTYTLRVSSEKGGDHVIFARVPFEELSALTDDLKREQLDPYAPPRPP